MQTPGPLATTSNWKNGCLSASNYKPISNQYSNFLFHFPLKKFGKKWFDFFYQNNGTCIYLELGMKFKWNSNLLQMQIDHLYLYYFFSPPAFTPSSLPCIVCTYVLSNIFHWDISSSLPLIPNSILLIFLYKF